MRKFLACVVASVLVGATAMLGVLAQTSDPLLDIPNADIDGAFLAAGSTVIHLENADSRAGVTWDGVPETLGDGVYDAEEFAVVFKYSSVDIPAGTSVAFTNHPTRAPVVWLVSGDVTIDGTLDLSGASHDAGTLFAVPGPGGFRGGSSGSRGSAGFGPGGSLSFSGDDENLVKSGGSYATPGGGDDAGPTYGNAELIPLLGGSGGAGFRSGGTLGGAGGGAILIIAENIIVNGTIVADGGDHGQTSSGGSGGAIRLVARNVGGTGMLLARGGGISPPGQRGGDGRIRIESESAIDASLEAAPAASTGTPSDPVTIFPGPTEPTVRIVSIGGVAAPSDPQANLSHSADVELSTSDPVDIVIDTGVEVDPATIVEVRITPREGAVLTALASHTIGTTWTASGVVLPQTVSALQVLVDTP